MGSRFNTLDRNVTRNDSGLSLLLSTPLCVFVCSKDNPAASCQEIYKKDAGAVSGAYWIKGKGKPFQVSMLLSLSLPKSFFFLGGGEGIILITSIVKK